MVERTSAGGEEDETSTGAGVVAKVESSSIGVEPVACLVFGFETLRLFATEEAGEGVVDALLVLAETLRGRDDPVAIDVGETLRLNVAREASKVGRVGTGVVGVRGEAEREGEDEWGP